MGLRVARLDLLFLATYVLLMVGIAWAMFAARARLAPRFAGDQRKQEWSQWREAVQQGDADMGRVKRKVPRSQEPPTLVLLRDHFAVCLIGLLGISSVLYGSVVFMLRGVLRGPSPSSLVDRTPH